MDFILKKIENKLSLEDPGSFEYIRLLRIQVEYSLFLCLGFVWCNLDELEQEKRTKILSSLNNMTIGDVESAIRDLDRNHNDIIVSKKINIVFGKYPNIRNTKIGHGYAMADSVASSLKPLYENLGNDIPLLKNEYDLIIVKSVDNSRNAYNGLRFPVEKNGLAERWSCPCSVFSSDEHEFPRVYISYNEKYYKISPFVFIDDKSSNPYVFNSLMEKIVGTTKMCPLFPDNQTGNEDNLEIVFNELVYLGREDGYRTYSKSNGTIMNTFTPNFANYIDVGVGVKSLVENFLFKNRAYVTATVWGHGGTGKTACIQKICYDLFNKSEKHFSYIVFITAKDRVYNTQTGSIDSATGNARMYTEVIESIIRTVFDCKDDLSDAPEKLSEYEKKISEFDSGLLIVIDDYETFEDNEKQKITTFLNSLNAQYHKAIITTRNKRFVIGEEIPSNELNVSQTEQFIKIAIEKEYPDHKIAMDKLLSDSSILNSIYNATSGHPAFIYQFIHLYVQVGYREDLIKGISTSVNAQEFLYGRIFQSLSQDAQYLFSTIQYIVDDDLCFKIEVLEHVLGKAIASKSNFESALEEIMVQKIVERINDVLGRVYSESLIESMAAHYKKYPEVFRETVHNLLSDIGGKNIKGSIVQALLEQADKSRAFSNQKGTIEKYRRVLNEKECPADIRRSALIRLVDYLSNAMLNPMSAISIIEEYIHKFEHDSGIYDIYIRQLWSQGLTEKEKAVDVISDFFSRHKKTDNEYLTFFALSVGYRIAYDINYKKYTDDRLRKNQYSKTFNEYGKELFDFLLENIYLEMSKNLFHNIQIALIQTARLCLHLSQNDVSKAKYGLEICSWMRIYCKNATFRSQIKIIEDELRETANHQPISNDSNSFELLHLQTDADSEFSDKVMDSVYGENRQYYVGDEVDVLITSIVDGYGAFAKIDKTLKGLIHISEIDNHYIKDIHEEFTVGETCRAKIIKIDVHKKKIALSTVELR